VPVTKVDAMVAIGYDDGGTGQPADPFGLESSTTAETTPRTVTSFKPSGVAALKAAARHITFSVGGSEPDEAPLSATVVGTDSSGTTQTETVSLDFILLTETPTNKLYASLTSVTYTAARPKPRLTATTSIGLGEFVGRMERWDKGLTSLTLAAPPPSDPDVKKRYHQMVEGWYRLGFVVNGVEVERDSTL
jgi:hypothetical protein